MTLRWESGSFAVIIEQESSMKWTKAAQQGIYAGEEAIHTC